MSIQARIEFIKDQDTAEAAIQAYGRFIEYYEKFDGNLKDRIRKSNRRDWSNDRVTLDRIKLAPCTAQKILAERWGEQVMLDAIRTHPFS